MTNFNNRVFGAVIVKAINSNYNADFTGQPRTLPNGTVYATDKAFKYTVRNYIKDIYPNDKIFFFKTLNDNQNPRTLDDTYEFHFGEFKKTIKKEDVLKNLLTCIDVRFFGATYAGKTNVSIHGPVQVNHGINIWHENNIFSEQITSPFANKSNDGDAEKGMTTIGRDTKLEEGHYLHHFSVNPQNIINLVSEGDEMSAEDINKLKEAMRKGATYYDSTSMAGTENEFMIWVQLNETSRLVLPNFTQLIEMKPEKKEGKVVLDMVKLSNELKKHTSEIENIEIYRNDGSIVIENQPEGAKTFGL